MIVTNGCFFECVRWQSSTFGLPRGVVVVVVDQVVVDGVVVVVLDEVLVDELLDVEDELDEEEGVGVLEENVDELDEDVLVVELVVVVLVVVVEPVEVEQYWYCDGEVQYWYPYAAEADRPDALEYPIAASAPSASTTRKPESVRR